MTRDQMVPDRLYYIPAEDIYFVTPDGVGCFWFDNMDEVDEAYGPRAFPTVYNVTGLTDY